LPLGEHLGSAISTRRFFVRLAAGAPMRYSRTVLEPSRSVSANDLVKNFLRRPENMKVFQLWMGTNFDANSKGNENKDFPSPVSDANAHIRSDYASPSCPDSMAWRQRALVLSP
jgi:hypothetical protein